MKMNAFVVGITSIAFGGIITLLSPLFYVGIGIIGISLCAGGAGVAVGGIPDLVEGDF